uniref:Apple domain-containing protein n=1 Tax=Strigamia maritima TaxID=126957 RepID=T1J1D8_STRMM
MTRFICSVFLLHLIATVNTQVCQGELGFEKIVNVALSLPTRELLTSTDNQPVTKDCLLLCLQSPDCFGFNLNYFDQECRVVSTSDSDRYDTSLFVPTSKSSFFRKICNIAVSNPKCNDMPWVIELVLASFMDKTSADETHEALTTDDCSNSCLSSEVCRAATFDDRKQTCVLHRQDRRTRPTAFHSKLNESRQYLENQCADLKSSNCHYQLSQNTTVVTKDAITNAVSQMECEHKCDQDERDLCRSYSYDSTSHLCYLSGDDAISLGLNATQIGGSHKIQTDLLEKSNSLIKKNCSNGPSAFERVTGRILQTVTTPEGPQPMDLTSDLTISCLKECQERGSLCVGVIMDYTNFLCQFVTERYSGSTYSDFSIAVGASYFERVCLTEIPSYCNERAWIFDRVPGSLLEGFDDKILHGILSRSECEDACLREKSFICRSAEYTSSIAECRLSQEDRRSRPDAFGAKNEAVDYLENQCIQCKLLFYSIWEFCISKSTKYIYNQI